VVYGDGDHRADKCREVWDWLTTKVELPCSYREQIESLSADVGLEHAHECAVRKIEDDGGEVIFEFHNGEVVALEYPGYVLLSKGDKEKWTPVTFRQLQSIIADEERGTDGISATALQAAGIFTKAQAEPQKARFGGCFDKGVNKYRSYFRTYWYKKDS
jgi:hypothetical protein